MNLKDRILNQVKEYKSIRGMPPDTLYLSETAFLYLLLIMHKEDRSQLRCGLLDKVSEGNAVDVVKNLKFFNMRVVIKEETSKSFYVRHTGETQDEASTIDLQKSNSLFSEVRKIFGI